MEVLHGDRGSSVAALGIVSGFVAAWECMHGLPFLHAPGLRTMRRKKYWTVGAELSYWW